MPWTLDFQSLENLGSFSFSNFLSIAWVCDFASVLVKYISYEISLLEFDDRAWMEFRIHPVEYHHFEWVKVLQIALIAGIMFWDVTTLLLDHKAFKDTIDIFVERYQDQKIDVIVGELEFHLVPDISLDCQCGSSIFSINMTFCGSSLQALKLVDSSLVLQLHLPLVPSLCLCASPRNYQVQILNME